MPLAFSRDTTSELHNSRIITNVEGDILADIMADIQNSGLILAIRINIQETAFSGCP